MSAEHERAFAEGFQAGLELNRSPVLDRDRRIRELVREWLGLLSVDALTGSWRNTCEYGVQELFEKSAFLIDKIDAAVIPPRESGEK